MDVIWLVIGIIFGAVATWFITKDKKSDVSGTMRLVTSERGTGVEIKFDKIEFKEGDIVHLLFAGEVSNLESQEDSGL